MGRHRIHKHTDILRAYAPEFYIIHVLASHAENLLKVTVFDSAVHVVIHHRTDFRAVNHQHDGAGFLRGLYHHHPIRVSIAGTVESIQEITAQTLYDCHKAFYHPANMTLCVVGDVDAEEVAAIAEEVLPKEKSSVAIPDLGPQEPETAVAEVSRREMDVAMTTFQLAFKCPPPARGRDHAHQELVAEMAAEMLFGQSSQLYQWLYEDGLIDSSFGGGEEFTAGTAMLTCGGDSRDPEEVRNCILNEGKFLAENGLDQAAFDRVKRSFLGIRFKDLTSFDATCFRLVAYSMEDHDYFDFPSIFQEVTIDEVRQFIADNVRPEKCSLSIVDPRRKD